ncbi:hypothetical protein RN001_003175 [Aquatica leii]|uniref:Uncharacterized protein n=1 Tax=Aquatica leii TaxID=1421715 RepID=A0AAN7SM62_9COLE|nr:hypothetical protein RN001_003175 [Aquatica leii]
MIKNKVILVVVLSFLLYVSADVNHTDNAQSRLNLSSNASLENLQEEPSFMSKIAGWIFPFSSTNAPVNDPISADANRRYDPQYLPPQQQCNPCNQEPWVPIASRHGHNTVIGFVLPGHPSSAQKYGPPSQYGTPQATSSQHRLPIHQFGPSSSLNEYHSQQHVLASSQYGPPSQHGSLTQQYGSPPSSQHGSPTQQYGPPLSSQYGSPTQQYGPPPSSQHGSPSQQYGPPPSSQYGSPTQQYGPPLTSHYGPPSQQYGLPASGQHILPTQQYAHSSSIHGGSLDQTGYHSDVKPNVKPPPANYEIPTYFIPPPPFKAKNLFKYSNRYKPFIKQSNQYKYQNKPKIPPPLPHHGPPIPLNFGETHSFETTQALSLEFKPPSVEPEIFKSYAPILTNYDIPVQAPQGNDALTSLNHQTYIGNTNPPVYTNINGPNFQPELSQSHPIHNSFISNSDYSNNQETVKSLQLIPSIRIADFVSTIDHPINVIQSPLVEVIATSNDIAKEQNSYENNDLQQQPIVVEDTHVSATAHNATYFNLIHEQNQHNAQLHEPHQLLNQNSQNLNINLIPISDISSVSSSVPPFNLDFNVNSHSSHFLPTVQINSHNSPTSQSLVENSNTNEAWNVENAKNGKTNDPPLFIPNFSTHSEHVNYTNNVVSTENLFTNLQNDNIFSKDKEFDSTFTNLSQSIDEKNNIFNSAFNFEWSSNIDSLSTAMVPPPINQPSWPTTKRPNHVQIIIPYKINDVKEIPSVLPLYTQPPSVDKSPVWSNFAFDHTQEGSKQITVTVKNPTESILSTQGFMSKDEQKTESGNEIFRLQKNIDGWTEQEFSNTVSNFQKSTSTIGKLIPSKKIPNEYLTTHPYSPIKESTTSKSIFQGFYNHVSGYNNQAEKTDINLNVISLSSTTPAPTTLTTTPSPEVTNTNLASMIPILSTLPNWEKLQLSISPLTKEKIYVVTPQPWKFIIPKDINNKLFPFTEAPRTVSNLAVVIKDGVNQTMADKDGLKVVYSEWPHLINKLVTTTTEEPKSTSHPLFGLMDLTSFTPPPNTITYGGHSKVITLVTPASTSKIDKRTTTRST